MFLVCIVSCVDESSEVSSEVSRKSSDVSGGVFRIVLIRIYEDKRRRARCVEELRVKNGLLGLPGARFDFRSGGPRWVQPDATINEPGSPLQDLLFCWRDSTIQVQLVT